MQKQILLFAAVTLLSACGGKSGAPADPSTAIVGSWHCNDEINLQILKEGRYEWQVPAGGVVIASASNEQVRVAADGSYALLGQWRLAQNRLELDMLGETETYQISFESTDALAMQGSERYTCVRK